MKEDEETCCDYPAHVKHDICHFRECKNDRETLKVCVLGFLITILAGIIFIPVIL